MIGASRPHKLEEFHEIVNTYEGVVVESWIDAVEELIYEKVKFTQYHDSQMRI